MKITKTFDTTGKKLLGIGMTAALVLSMSATAFAMSDSIQESCVNGSLKMHKKGEEKMHKSGIRKRSCRIEY